MRVFNTLLLLTLLSSISQAQFNTSTLAPMPEAVSNNAVTGAIFNGEKYLFSFSGIDTSKSYTGIHLKAFKYSFSTDSWETLPPLPDTMGKIAAAASEINDVVYIIGGYHVFANGSEVSSNKVHRFDIATNTYLPDGSNIPVPIDDHVQAVYKDSLIYVVTGWSQNNNVANVQIYDPSNDLWLVGTPLPNNSFYKAFGASGTIVGDTIYYFGGARFGGNFPIQNWLRKGYIDPSNPTNILWTHTVLENDLVGYRMASASHGTEIRWIGGSDQTYNYDGIAYAGGAPVPNNRRILTYETSTGIWDTTFYQNIPMDLRGVAYFGCDMFVVGGMIGQQEVTDQTLMIQCLNTGQKELLKNTGIQLFPNPAHSYIEISGIDYPATVQLSTVEGIQIKEWKISGTVALPIYALRNGIYLLEIFGEGRQKLHAQLVVKS